MTAAGAERILEAWREAARESAEKMNEYDRYVQDWERNRIRAGEKAYMNIIEKRVGRDHAGFQASATSVTVSGGRPLKGISGLTRSEAREARVEALTEFEAGKPLKSFEEWS